MTYLRMDEDTGAKFAGSRIADDEAVVHLITAPRDGVQPARTETTVAFFRDWLEQLPAAVSRISAWATSIVERDFLRTLGFEDAAPLPTHGGHGMVLTRTH